MKCEEILRNCRIHYLPKMFSNHLGEILPIMLGIFNLYFFRKYFEILDFLMKFEEILRNCRIFQEILGNVKTL